MSILDAEQSARYIDSLVASVQALEADLAATRDKLRRAEADYCEANLQVESVLDVLSGEDAADYQRVFAVVRGVSDLQTQLSQAQARIAALEQERDDALRQANGDPKRPTLLNAYGRRCYEAGHARAQADARGREEER